MDATLESIPETFNLKDEITKTTELIRELSEAIEPLAQGSNILELERRRLYNEIDRNKHRMLTDWISRLISEIEGLEAIPSKPYRTPILGRSIPFPTNKELAEPIQRTKIQFQHNTKNLAGERKVARELQEHERVRQQQLEIEAAFELREKNLQEKLARYNKSHRPKPLPKKTLKSSVVMLVESIEHASSGVLRDSKNTDPTKQSYERLQNLRKTSKQFYLQSNIDKDKFVKHWNLMRGTRNSIVKIRFDLMKECGRHAEGYAESERLRQETIELNDRISKMSKELKEICREERKASKYLVKLQKNQSEVASRLP